MKSWLKFNKHVAYPFTHEAIVLWKANKLEGSLLYEVGVEDPYLWGVPGHRVRYRLPEALCSLLKKEKEKNQREALWYGQMDSAHPRLHHEKCMEIFYIILQQMWRNHLFHNHEYRPNTYNVPSLHTDGSSVDSFH